MCLILLAHPTRFERVTFAFGGQRSRYAASRGTLLSISRKNRVLRAPATNVAADIRRDVDPHTPVDFPHITDDANRL
jgi:hypothetical protein